MSISADSDLFRSLRPCGISPSRGFFALAFLFGLEHFCMNHLAAQLYGLRNLSCMDFIECPIILPVWLWICLHGLHLPHGISASVLSSHPLKPCN